MYLRIIQRFLWLWLTPKGWAERKRIAQAKADAKFYHRAAAGFADHFEQKGQAVDFLKDKAAKKTSHLSLVGFTGGHSIAKPTYSKKQVRDAIEAEESETLDNHDLKITKNSHRIKNA